MAKVVVSVESVRLRMADLCSRSEQCEADIRQKLYRYGLSAVDVQSVIDFLKENGFIDNSRYARSYAHDKCRFSSWGRNKIKMGLIAKRISASDISVALASIEEKDYEEALKRAAEAKSRDLDFEGENAYAERVKLFRHLVSRGFESSLASKAVKHYAVKIR